MPYTVYDFIIKSLRNRDLDGDLEAFLEGFQALYEASLLNMELYRRLYTPFNNGTGTQLDAPLQTLGMESTILSYLSDEQKRGLLWDLISIWKTKGLKIGLKPYLASLGGLFSSYDERWDFQWLLNEIPLCEDNFVLTPEDSESIVIYATNPAFQTANLSIGRSKSGLVRVIFKDLTAANENFVIDSNSTLIFEIKREGGDGHSGFDMRLDGTEWIGELGAGDFSIRVVDYTRATLSTFTIQVQASTGPTHNYTLTEGTDYDAETSNLVTAQNIATAINTNCPGAEALAYGPCVHVFKAPGTTAVTVSGLYAGAYTSTTDQMLFDQNGAPLNTYLKATTDDGWQLHEYDISALAGKKITDLAIYDNNVANNGELCNTKIRRVLLVSTLLERTVPLYMYKSISMDIEESNDASLVYKLTNYMTYTIDHTLMHEVVKGFRPVGTRIELVPVFDRAINFKEGMPRVIWEGGVTVDTPVLTLATDDTNGEPTIYPIDTLCYLGQQHYSVSTLVDVIGSNADITIKIAKGMNGICYRLTLDFLTGDAMITKVLNGSIANMAGTVLDVRGTRHRVHFIADGHHLILALDGTVVLETTDTSIPYLTGSWVLSGHDLDVREVSVIPVPSKMEVVKNE